MNGLDFIANLRRAGFKPDSVFLDVTDEKPRKPSVCDGRASVEFGRDESLADADFRPLVGLRVHVGLMGGDYERVKRIAKRAAEVKPELLCVWRQDSDSLTTLYRLGADGTMDKFQG